MQSAKPTNVWDLGGCRITLISGGGLKLDGGAMFGIVPKALWSRTTPSDEENRIQLACTTLLVEWDGDSDRRALIETGHGPKFAEKEQKIFAIDPANWLLPSLTAAGVDPETIGDVVVTHLHFDHAGGLTYNPDPHGENTAYPTFPRARVHVQRQEFDDARANFGVMNFTYREENFRPIDDINAWQLHEGEVCPVPNVRLIPTPGHTRGHQSVLVEGRHRAILFLGDLMPTRNHIGPPYNMAFDLFPMDNRETKIRTLAAAAAKGWLIVLGHDVLSPVARVVADGDHFHLEPAQP